MKLSLIPATKTPHIIEHGGKLYITGSEFSELFVHEDKDNDLNSTFALHATMRGDKVKTPLKVANFRKINWAALEKGPIGKHKSPSRHLGVLPFASTKQKRKMSLHNPD